MRFVTEVPQAFHILIKTKNSDFNICVATITGDGQRGEILLDIDWELFNHTFVYIHTHTKGERPTHAFRISHFSFDRVLSWCYAGLNERLNLIQSNLVPLKLNLFEHRTPRKRCFCFLIEVGGIQATLKTKENGTSAAQTRTYLIIKTFRISKNRREKAEEIVQRTPLTFRGAARLYSSLTNKKIRRSRRRRS